jgi:hypothetical protein
VDVVAGYLPWYVITDSSLFPIPPDWVQYTDLPPHGTHDTTHGMTRHDTARVKSVSDG